MSLDNRSSGTEVIWTDLDKLLEDLDSKLGDAGEKRTVSSRMIAKSKKKSAIVNRDEHVENMNNAMKVK